MSGDGGDGCRGMGRTLPEGRGGRLPEGGDDGREDGVRWGNCHIKFPRAPSKVLELGSLWVSWGSGGERSRFLGYARNDMGGVVGMT